MYDLSYFNLGFRSDSVCNSLSEIKTKREKSSPVLKDAFSIVKDCLKTKEDDVIISKLSPGKGYETRTISPILRELFPEKDTISMIKDLRDIYHIINKIEKNDDYSDPEIDLVIEFFSKIADICLSNSAQQALPNNLSYY